MLRLQRMLTQNTVQIGTTANAFANHAAAQQRHQTMRRIIQRHVVGSSSGRRNEPGQQQQRDADPTSSNNSWWFRAPHTLLVHSPDHGSGKTMLVETLAAGRLGGAVIVHVIQAGHLLAKYGVYADMALQCNLHGAVVAAAVRQRPIVVLLDHVDAFLPMPTTTDYVEQQQS